MVRTSLGVGAVMKQAVLLAALSLWQSPSGNGQPSYTLEIDVLGEGTVAQEPLCHCGPGEIVGPTGDVSEDCRVNLADYGLLASAWLRSGDLQADLDGNLVVDLADLALLGDDWLAGAIPDNCTDPNRTSFWAGEKVELTAAADDGWVFHDWSGSIAGTTNPVTVTIDGDESITASFEPQAITSDEFTGGELDSELWSVVDPCSDGSLTLTGQSLLIDVPAGASHAGPALMGTDSTELVLHMKLDDDPGDGVLDSSWHQNDGNTAGSHVPVLAPGHLGQAYRFDGDDDYVQIPDDASLDVDHITLAAWVYVDQYQDDQRIISKEYGTSEPYSIYTLLLSGTGDSHLQMRIGVDGLRRMVTSISEVPLGQWTHVAGVFDGHSVALYINGQLDYVQYGITGVIQDNNQDVVIGASQFYTQRCFDGVIDEVRIYNTALSDADLARLAAEDALGGLPDENLSVRVMQELAGDGDFEVEVKFDSEVSLANQIQGLLVEQDSDRYLVFDVYSGAAHTWVLAASYNGTADVKANTIIAPGAPYYLRLGRQSNTWNCSYSYDGQNWIAVASFNDALTVHSVGAFVGNHNYRQNVPSFMGVIDYFYNTAEPIEYVDPDPNTNTVDLNIFGSGQVMKVPDKTGYALDEQVSLTAQADTNWTFAGWSGALGGAANPAGLTVSGDHLVTAIFKPVDPSEFIDLWYGPAQTFGALGVPQPWANVLGNVAQTNGLVSLTYSVNSTPEEPLSVGPAENLRLARPGDFNAEIAYADLDAGANDVTLTATYSSGEHVVRTLALDYAAGHTWPEPYSIDWSTVTDVQEATQVVDGLWQLDTAGVHPAQTGYDRLLALGDLAWDDYELTVSVTVNSVDIYTGQPGGQPAVGLLVRWPGHYDWGDDQPRLGWYPMGALAWFKWATTSGSGAYQFVGSDGIVGVSNGTGPSPPLAVPYVWKVRAQGHVYRLKVWPADEAEPGSWLLTYQSQTADPLTGSLLLLAHHCDISFGDVAVTPLP